MNRILLIDRLRSALEGRKVKSALFHTFNFDPEFFENYLLPIFFPELPFGDNKIQNSILWRRYHTRLPPITVYCDFYGKSNNAPQLPYVVRSVDMAVFFRSKHKTKSLSGCFHPKISFLLLDDDSLVVITGSNNLTASGWCTNLEVFSIVRLENGVNFPRDLKDAFADFVLKIQSDLVGTEITKSEVLLGQFFRRQKYTGNVAVSNGENGWSSPNTFPLFFSSLNGSFFEFLERLRDEYNEGEPFSLLETVSPYYSSSNQIADKEHLALVAAKINLSIPFAGIDAVALDRVTFDDYEKFATWCLFNDDSSSRGFRFNHSKIWRLKGKDKVITIVGSVNCTMAACIGLTDVLGHSSANLEAAIVHMEPVEKWRPLLKPTHDTTYYEFNSEAENDEPGKDRFSGTVPKLEFSVDWNTGILACRNKDDSEITGVIMNNQRRIKVAAMNSVELPLKEDEILMLSDNPIVDFHFSGKNQRSWDFYVTQLGYQCKPVPFRLKLNDSQVLELWKDLGSKSTQMENKVHNFIESLLEAVCAEDGVVDDKSELLGKSTLNAMAAHLSALINLETWLHTHPKNSRERNLHEERLSYYLTTNNIDTIPGYLELMSDRYKNGKLNSALFWMILELLCRDIYHQASKANVTFPDKPLLEKYKKQIQSLQKSLKFNDTRLTRAHLDWAAKELK